MVSSPGCGRELTDLRLIISKCLRELEDVMSGEYFRCLSLSDIKDELSRLSPYLRVVFSRWVPEIIYALYIRGRLSFNEMKRAFGVSSRVLTDKLRALEDLGLIRKEVDASVRPIRVYYELTRLGREVGVALVPILTILKEVVKGRGITP